MVSHGAHEWSRECGPIASVAFAGFARIPARAEQVEIDLGVADFEMEGRAAPSGHAEPAAPVQDGLAQVFAQQAGLVQVVMLEDELIAAGEVFGGG
jgi:hypothetical protein